MRVGLFNTRALWGGGEQWCAWAARGLRERGHEVAALVGRASVLGERLGTAGIRAHRARGGLFRVLAARRFFRSFRPDVVILNAGGETRAAVLARGKRSVPRLVLRRGLCRGIKGGLLHARLYRRVDGFLANSEATLRELTRTNPWIAARHPRVVYNPVPPLEDATPEEIAAWRERLEVDREDLVVLSVGRCDPDKGHVHLLEAFEGLLESEPRARLVIAGEGPEREALTARVAERGELRGRVLPVGFVERPAALYGLADVLAMPSLPGYESFSNAALEGMSRGLPLVATTVGGFPELVGDGRTGLLVPPADVGALRGALARLLADERLRETMGRTARETVLAAFDPARKLDELEEYLAGLAA